MILDEALAWLDNTDDYAWPVIKTYIELLQGELEQAKERLDGYNQLQDEVANARAGGTCHDHSDCDACLQLDLQLSEAGERERRLIQHLDLATNACAELTEEKLRLAQRVKMLEDREQLTCYVLAESTKPKLENRKLKEENSQLREALTGLLNLWQRRAQFSGGITNPGFERQMADLLEAVLTVPPEKEKLTCADCPAPYGEDGWCYVVVPNEIWNTIALGRGVLCFRCMTKRIIAAGLADVPVIVASRPYSDENEEWRLIGWDHGYKVAKAESVPPAKEKP